MEIKDRILVVEDDKRISSFFKTVLESNRYDVIMASTGSEAYSLITSQCPDLVILDLGLPDQWTVMEHPGGASGSGPPCR